jgi:hypothetical protein
MPFILVYPRILDINIYHRSYPGYLLSSTETTTLLNALEIPKMVASEPDVKLLGNSVLITPRPAPHHIIQKVGGLGTKVEFEVTGLGHWDNRVWAARVKSTDPSAKIYTGSISSSPRCS